MRKILFIAMMLVSGVAMSQTTNTDWLNARKGIFLRNYRVDTITNVGSGVNWSNYNKTLPTAKAVHEYLKNNITTNLPLVNFEGDVTTYPVGIFSPDTKTFIGIATNDAEAKAMFDTSAEVLSKGSVKAVSGGYVEFIPKYLNTVINFYGLEYYTVRSSSPNPVLHVDDGDVIRVNTTTLLGSGGTNTLSSSVNEYNGVWGLNVTPAFTYRALSVTASSNTDIHVFHNRLSRWFGTNVLTPLSYLGGRLPDSLKSFQARATGTTSLAANLTNWSAIQNLKWYAIMNLGGSPYNVTIAANYPQPPASVIGLQIADFAGTSSPIIMTWFTGSNFPNLEYLVMKGNGNDIITPSISQFATFPLVKKSITYLNNGGAFCSAAIADQAIIDLNAAIGSITPSAPASIRLQNTTARTTASNAAYNNLISKGWTITLN
jgi:hypothetical protein